MYNSSDALATQIKCISFILISSTSRDTELGSDATTNIFTMALKGMSLDTLYHGIINVGACVTIRPHRVHDHETDLSVYHHLELPNRVEETEQGHLSIPQKLPTSLAR